MKLRTLPETSWLIREEQPLVVKRLFKGGMMKVDPTRRLPLKMGGETDIYINIRNGRSNPKAHKFVAGLYAGALNKLKIDRFVEVPEAVSGLAGILSAKTGIPYLTIREVEKTGRATSATVVGEYQFGDRVVIIDDVITNGASKVEVIRKCEALGLVVVGIIVLVDRQQGWRHDFARFGIPTRVWAGMTLHDVRREAIALGIMKRCDEETERKNRLIVALDGKPLEGVMSLADQLRASGSILKVNDLLLKEGFDWIMRELSPYGRLMLDPKLHDIPNTVRNVCAHMVDNPPWAITVHASGGVAMMKEAVRALSPLDTNVLAVTVLTSIDKETCETIYHRTPKSQVIAFAEAAVEAGVQGFVCSVKEAEMMHRRYPGMLIVTPGIRPAGSDVGDQKRVDTPANALRSGSTHLVVGRPITDNENPLKAAYAIMDEMAA